MQFTDTTYLKLLSHCLIMYVSVSENTFYVRLNMKK